jgi:hypothetical protein
MAGTLSVGCILFLGITSEFFKEFGNAGDLRLLQLCPVHPYRIVAYRMIFALMRTTQFSLALAFFPVYVAWSVYSSLRLVALLGVALGFFLLCLALALWTAVLLLTITGPRVPRNALLIAFNVSLVLISIIVLYVVVDRSGWDVNFLRLHVREPAIAFLFFLAAFFVASGYALFRHAVSRVPRITGSEPAAARLFVVRQNAFLFSESDRWAILQKDFRDLIRNPAYKYGAVSCLLILLLVLWGQWQGGGAAQPSSRRMMGSLSLVYIVPLLISARTVSLELRLLGFYRLVLRRLGRLLDLKWQAQSLLNCLIVAVLSFPYFPLIRRGPRPFEFVFFAGCVLTYVPLMTMLALALGAFFPSDDFGTNPVGMNKWGIILYLLLAVPLYSFLLNYMVLGILVYSLFLTSSTLLLFFGARRRLVGLCGQ